MDRMPAYDRLGAEHETQVGFLLHTYEKACNGDPVYLMTAGRRVMGLGLPSWQREEAWTDAQCEKFIESAWKGIPLGFWILNVVDADAPHPLEGLVIDGQQRLRALQRYIDGDITVAARDGSRPTWDELTVVERRRFAKARFPYIQISETDELKLQQFYDTYNFGGTRHQEHERAVGKALDTAGVILPATSSDADRRPVRRGPR